MIVISAKVQAIELRGIRLAATDADDPDRFLSRGQIMYLQFGSGNGYGCTKCGFKYCKSLVRQLVVP